MCKEPTGGHQPCIQSASSCPLIKNIPFFFEAAHSQQISRQSRPQRTQSRPPATRLPPTQPILLHQGPSSNLESTSLDSNCSKITSQDAPKASTYLISSRTQHARRPLNHLMTQIGQRFEANLTEETATRVFSHAAQQGYIAPRR
ncbi:hypothetical protein IWX49DRAFT_552882 [Phyllosticta citricarpa]